MKIKIWMIVLATLLSFEPACTRDSSQQQASANAERIEGPMSKASDSQTLLPKQKYHDGQRVQFSDGTVTIAESKCDSAGCSYLVYFNNPEEVRKAVKENREVKNAWVPESQLGAVVPIFAAGQQVCFTAQPQSVGVVTRSACSSGRCIYIVHYSDNNGVFRETT